MKCTRCEYENAAEQMVCLRCGEVLANGCIACSACHGCVKVVVLRKSQDSLPVQQSVDRHSLCHPRFESVLFARARYRSNTFRPADKHSFLNN